MVSFLKSMRPAQWTKNLIVFAGLIFSGNLFNLDLLVRSAATFGIFCILSGSMYILNDLIDRKHDIHHPLKSKRPLSLGTLSSRHAKAGIPVLVLLSLVLSWLLEPRLLIITGIYAVLMSAYSFWLKKIPILDVLVISFGLVLRALGGTSVIHVEVSLWLFVCTILLALYLALCKRRHELLTLNEDAIRHRQVLAQYTDRLLDQMIAIVTASTLIAYALYTISPETIAKFNTKNLVLTFPLVVYGIFRYLYLVYKEQAGGAPERLLFRDRPLVLTMLLWMAAVGFILYV